MGISTKILHPSNLIGSWNGNSYDGNYFIDRARNCNLTKGTGQGVIQSKIGKGINCAGSSYGAEGLGGLSYNIINATIILKFTFKSSSAYNGIFSYTNDAGSNVLFLYKEETNKMRFYIQKSGYGTTLGFKFDYTFEDGKYYEIPIVLGTGGNFALVNGNLCNLLYTNGNQYTEESFFRVYEYSTMKIVIGDLCQAYPSPYQGVIDYVEVYNCRHTEKELALMYNFKK